MQNIHRFRIASIWQIHICLASCSCLLLLLNNLNAQELRIVSRDQKNGALLCESQGKRVLFVGGTPEQMGAGHGNLLRQLIPHVTPRTMSLVGAAYSINSGIWFYDRMDEIYRRGAPFTPERYLREIKAMATAAGISEYHARCMNFFPELFHCSGIAVRGSASLNGQILHVRVLDYMAGVNMQNYTTLQVFLPEGLNAWVSVGYAAFLGTVTAMNEKGLAIGEMGGKGEGNWDGIPMTFLMRQIMEEAATVQEALAIMRKSQLTCEYYYVLSDANGEMVGLYCNPEKMEILQPGQQHPLLPTVPADTIMISAGNRAKVLSERLQQQHGKITPQILQEIIKRPVAMNSNLHNAIFRPTTLDLWFADAGKNTPACDEKYAAFNLLQMLEFYRTSR